MQPIFESSINTSTEVIYLISYIALASLDFKLSVTESVCQCNESYFLRLSVNTIITGNTSNKSNSKFNFSSFSLCINCVDLSGFFSRKMDHLVPTN